MSSNLDLAHYSAGDIIEATGISQSNLQDYVRRGGIVLGANDIDANGSGSRRMFTTRTAIQIGITVELVRLGLNFRRAARSAAALTHWADGPTGYAGDARVAALSRDPGQLFGNEPTLLVCTGESADVVRASEYSDQSAAIVVTIDPIVARLNRALRVN